MRTPGRVAVPLLLALSLAIASCGDHDSPTGPSGNTFTMNGRWTGDISVLNASALMTWTLVQSGGTVTGPAVVTLPNGVVVMNAEVNGTFAGRTLTYTMTANPGGIPAVPGCSGQLGGTATATTGSPATLNGTYSIVSSTCAPPFTTGSFLLRR